MTHHNSFKKIYDDHYVLLCRSAYTILRNRDAARDVVQEVFIIIWNKREKWNDIKCFKTYLLSAVYNRSITAYHTQKKTIRLDDVNYPPPVVSEDKSLEYIELELQVSIAINHLPEKCKEIFLLKREEDLTYKEIAEQLGITVKTVENQMGIALKRIKVHLDNEREGKKKKSVFVLGGVIIFLVY